MFWLIFAFVFGAALLALVLWLRSKNIFFTWYEWVIGIIGLILLIAAVQHFTGSLREDYMQPGLLGLAVFGIPSLVLIAVVWQLVSRRQRT